MIDQRAQTAFWAKVEKTDDCWAWRGRINSDGYGRHYLSTGDVAAHRLAYELCVGPIPKGLTIDHLCRNRGCVNPGHMEPVTNRENVLRGVSPAAVNARKTHCKHGHPLSGENLMIVPRGRECRECGRLKSLRWSRAKKGQPSPDEVRYLGEEAA